MKSKGKYTVLCTSVACKNISYTQKVATCRRCLKGMCCEKLAADEQPGILFRFVEMPYVCNLLAESVELYVHNYPFICLTMHSI